MPKHSNADRIIMESIYEVISESLRSHPSFGYGYIGNITIQDRLENLGFRICNDGRNDRGRLTCKIKYSDWTDEIEGKLLEILNFYGYFLSGKGNGTDLYDGEPIVCITIETIYGNREKTLDTYYHAASDSKVPKILRQGLIPKSSDPMRNNAPGRIYLCKHNNEYLFDTVRGGNDYKIFKVDLSGIKDKVSVYTDNLAVDSVYTYDYIPPECLSVVEKSSDKHKKYISQISELIDNKICSKINGLQTIGNKLIGSFYNEVKGVNIEVNVVFGHLVGCIGTDASNPLNSLGMEGHKIITYPNGRHKTVKLEKNFNLGFLPRKLLSIRDFYAHFEYLSDKMVDYLLKWILN